MIHHDKAYLQISIHALRGEGDPALFFYPKAGGRFQSTPSVGRATKRRFGISTDLFNISIHALRGEGDGQTA